MPNYPDEDVLVVPREALFGGDVPQGYGDEGGDMQSLIMRIEEQARFLPRDQVEEDPSLKQVIPYILVCKSGQVLVLRRKAKQAEARLHDKVSIGVGGHINREEGCGPGVVERGLRRELHEELVVDGEVSVRPVGWINDDSNPVGSVHFGLVYRVDADAADVTIHEKDRMSGEFMAVEALAPLYEAMETWSQIVYDHVVCKA